MRRLRENKSFKAFAVFIALNMLFQLGLPTVSFALTSGPAQEEFASFEPASTTDMVDLYSGDFTYNIPLLSVPGPNGGYPINLSYHSGVGMEQEASWVGLGWNVNVGAINRQLRGLPDDFNGDQIQYEYDFKNNVTVGLTGPQIKKEELFGFPVSTTGAALSANFDWQIYYNNYKGLGARVMLDLTYETSSKFGLGLGLTLDSQGGLGIAPSISMKSQMAGVKTTNSLSANINNRQGLTDIGFTSSVTAGALVSSGANSNAIGGVMGKSSSSLSFATNHAVPQVSIPFSTSSVPFEASIGDPGQSPDYFGEYSSSFPYYWKGYVNTTTLVDEGNFSSQAYGYLNTQNASEDDVKDFSRNSLEYSKKVPNLAASNYTYDLFTYTGQGVGGMFRPYRSTVDVLTDANRVNKSSTNQVSLEFGINQTGNTTNTHIGFGFPYEKSESHSGAWTDGADMVADIDAPSNAGGEYEYAYFQEYGEKTGIVAQDIAENQLLNWEGDQAIRLDIKKTAGWANKSFFVDDDYRQTGSAAIVSITNDEYSKRSNNTREKRAKVINKLTATEAFKYGFSKDLQYIDAAGVSQPKFSAAPSGSKGEHISEIEVVEPDGMRYYYGLPAYNNTQIDETMATAAQSTNGVTPVEATTNTGTTNEYRKKTTLPAYVHSWMLTAVTSADYVDITGDGPTEDDLGYYTKFNYQKQHDNYKWRLPYVNGSFMEGTNSSDDNMVAYTYGEKEIYFLHSIETKTHVAQFKLVDRTDGKGANGQYASAAGTQSMKKLENIRLYSKNELAGGATPIKTVNFNYDYSLCQGIPNGTQGKLTLKGLNFTYENSSRGSLSPYEFHYENSNPNYNRMAMDRWGKYKNLSSYTGTYPSEVFPYNDQDVDDAAPWDLTRIELPTGGTLNIDYEEDDYSYVEGEKPMKMFDVIGVDDGNIPTVISNRFNTQTSDDFDGYRVYFALEESIDPTTDPNYTNNNNYVKEHYFDNNSLKKMWFKALIDIKDGNIDYVTGYANIDYNQTFGLENIGGSAGTYNTGYFYVQSETLSATGGSLHPFRKAAFQYLQMARSELLYGSSPITNVAALLGSVITNLVDLTSMITGYNNFCYLAQYGKTIYFGGESIVKLYDENQIKYGGGSRVKQLTIDDNWDNNEDGTKENSSYGQVYNYTLANGLSSGVAYEPRIGGEESALRKPVNYSESTFLASTKNLFVEEPILESYYPGASVGYSRVTVKSIAPDIAYADNSSNNLLLTSAPITEYEFYTAKDFPIWTDQTDLSNDPDIVRPLIVPGVYTNYKKKRARSQGYSIVLNDMAGKTKAITQKTRPSVNNLLGNIISKVEYVYQTASPYDASHPNHLNNKVNTLNKNGTYTEAIIGQSHDIFIDMNENRMKSSSKNIDFNIDLSVVTSVPPVLMFMIVPLPYWGDVQLSTKTVVTNKVIYRTGILKEVITTTNESVIKQANLAYDINTGSPLLTQVTNEYKDPIYTHNIPAHWYYTGMEGAYQNIGYETSVINYSGGFVIVPDASMFHVGDEVGVEPLGERLFVTWRDLATNELGLSRHCTTFPNPTAASVSTIKVLRSGHRNMLTASAGNVVSKVWDFKSTAPTNLEELYEDALGNSQVIDANAIEFKDTWQKYRDCARTCSANPYITGLSGNWRFYKSHKFNSDRIYASANGNKTDGVYSTFDQFDWLNPSANPSWVLTNEVTRYSPYGFEVENRDALNNYSSARYGYGDALNTAVAYNARQFEIGVIDFEQDFVDDCGGTKPYLFQYDGDVVNTEAHTGKRSLRIPALGTVVNYFTTIPQGTAPLQPGYEPTEVAGLELIQGEKYIISAWVKEVSTGTGQDLLTYASPYIRVDFNTVPTNPIYFEQRGENEIIEGWQRIELEIEIPVGVVNSVGISLMSSSTTENVFFDDFRIQPADANMKTFVYDNVSLKLMAEMDENNYATFYIYDEQGALSKVKKETEHGIVTISEGRSSNVK